MKKSTLQDFVDGQAQKDYIYEILLSDYSQLIPIMDLGLTIDLIQEKMAAIMQQRIDTMKYEADEIDGAAESLNITSDKVVDSYIIFNLIVENVILLTQLLKFDKKPEEE